jgi:hypothetical protein
MAVTINSIYTSSLLNSYGEKIEYGIVIALPRNSSYPEEVRVSIEKDVYIKLKPYFMAESEATNKKSNNEYEEVAQSTPSKKFDPRDILTKVGFFPKESIDGPPELIEDEVIPPEEIFAEEDSINQL